jgi:hypothetical protein
LKNKSWPQADGLLRRYRLSRLGKLLASDVVRNDVEMAIAHVRAPILSNQVLAAF